MPKTPFTPKPWGVGAAVTVDGRSGTIWSAGPIPASAWVLEDDGGSFVAKLPTKSREAYVVEGLHSSGPAYARLEVAERIRHGYAVQGRYVPVVHTFATCEEAVGEPAQGLPLGRVALRFLRRQEPTGTEASPRLCPCIHRPRRAA